MAWIYLDGTGRDERFRQAKCADKVWCFAVGPVQLEESVDFIADQVQSSLLAKLHEVE